MHYHRLNPDNANLVSTISPKLTGTAPTEQHVSCLDPLILPANIVGLAVTVSEKALRCLIVSSKTGSVYRALEHA